MEERFKLMEPGKGFGVGIAFSIDKLAEIVKDYPVYVEKQYSGVRLSVTKDGKDIKMELKDGTDITHRLPTFVAKLEEEVWPKQLVMDCIAEMWLGNKVQMQEVLEEHLRQEKQLFEGEDKYVVLHVFDVMWMQDDIRGLSFEDRRSIHLNSLPILQSTEREPKAGGFNRMPSRIGHSLESMINVVKNVSGMPGSRGAMIRVANSVYEEGESSSWVRFDNVESYTVVILNKKEGREPGICNYCLGVALSDKFDIGDSEIIEVDGKKFIFMAKVKSAMELNIGDKVKLTAESVKLYSDKVRFYMPQLIKASKEEPMTLENIVEVAKDAGVFLQRDVGTSVWPKENILEAVINSYVHGDSYSCYGLSIPIGQANEIWEFGTTEIPNGKKSLLSNEKKTVLEYGSVVITPIEKVKLEFGARKEDFFEYFCESEHLSGRLLFRQIDGGWKTWLSDNDVPYVLTLEAQTEGWIPPLGISALPKEMREKVPERFRYWLEEDKEKRIKTRNTLRKARNIHFNVVKPLGKGTKLHLLERKGHHYTGEGEITAGVTTVNMAELDRITTADAKIGEFTLQKHWWKGEKLGNISHYDLFIDEIQVVLSDDPVKKGLPFENEHSCRMNDPGKYDDFARKNCEQRSEGKCIDVVYGVKPGGSTEIQALRYKEDVWTEGEARSHCNSRGGSFEAAKTNSEKLQFTCECDECGEVFESEGTCSEAICPECGTEGARRFSKVNAQIRKPYSKDFQKKGLKSAEMVAAKAPGNPSNYPSYVEQIDSGEAITVVDEENFKRFNFKGKKIQGSYCLQRTKEGNAWNFWKEKLAQGKTLKLKQGESIVKHTITLAVDNIELESDNVAIVSGAALSFGVWNGDWFAPDVVADRPERVLGIPYTVGDHDVRENHGKIIDFELKDNTIWTKARVEGEKPVKDLQEGKFPGQSVEITVLSDEERHIIKRILSYDRLNAVDYPACVVCNVDNIEAE